MKALIYITILLRSAIWFISCRTQYIPVETVRTEYKTRDSIRVDSIYNQDSIYVLVKGDTVYQYRYKYLYKYQYLNRADTMIKIDSVQVPYPVEKQLTRWQQMKIELGGWAFGVIIAFGLVISGWVIYSRIRKK
jgi:hypothetical protein